MAELNDGTGRRGPGTTGAAKGWETRRAKGWTPPESMGRPSGPVGSTVAKHLTRQYDRPLRDVLIETYNRTQSLRKSADELGVNYVTFCRMCAENDLAVVSVLVATDDANLIMQGTVVDITRRPETPKTDDAAEDAA